MAKQTPIKQEIATTANGRDITRGFISEILTPQDTVLQEQGGNFEVYERVLRDDQVGSTFQQRRKAVTSCEWEVVPGGPSRRDRLAADSIRAQLEGIDFDGATERMLFGLFYGYAVSELMWDSADGEVVLQGIKVRKARRFRWGIDGRLRLLTLGLPQGEVMPDCKFWTFTTGSDNDDDPYGVGLAHWLYWPTFFKRHDLKFWLVFLEKFGMPTAHGTYPRGAHESEQTKLLEALAAIQTDSGVITPEGMKITLLEAARSGSNTYEAMANKMDAAIAKVVLSQTMTTDSGSSRSQAEVHQGVALWVIKSDADLVCQSFNRSVVRWLTDWNFPGARAPQVWRRVTPPADLESHARRDKLIFDMGYRPTARHIADTYGGDWVPALLTNPEKSEFSEPAVAELEEAALLEKTAEQGDPVLSRWIERVRELLQEAASLEDFRDKLLTLVPDLSPTTLGEVMEQALGVANLMGRAEIQDGR